MYAAISIKHNTFLPIETVGTVDESKKNKVDVDSIQSVDSRMSKSEIKIAKQSQRKRYFTHNSQIFFLTVIWF